MKEHSMTNHSVWLHKTNSDYFSLQVQSDFWSWSVMQRIWPLGHQPLGHNMHVLATIIKVSP
jgi:hypothetical protein